MALLIGTYAALRFSKGNYKNIKKITDMIMLGGHTAGQEHASNEWYLINDAVARFIKENTSLQQKLGEHLPIIRNDFFYRLLAGEMKDQESIETMTAFLGIKLDYRSYGVLLASMDSYEDIKDAVGEPELDVIRLSLANQAEEYCAGFGRGYAVQLGKDRIAVVAAFDSDDYTASLNSLRNATLKLCGFVFSNFGITITAAISDIHEDVTHVQTAYTQAENALNYRLIKGENTVICFTELGNREDRGCYYTFDQERQLMQFLRQGDFDSIKKLLDSIVDFIKTRPVPIEIIRCTYFDIINTAVRSLYELGIKGFGYEEHLYRLINGKSLAEVYEEACSFYSVMCEHINNAKHMKNDDLRNRIVEYINSNYTDSGISVESIADSFSVSSSYISRFIKDQIGSSFVDYVNGLRLEKAKQLLSETEMSVGEIAAETGYNSVYNFTRVFKRYENITPTQYRLSGIASSKVCER